jgi:hypothetical protein
LASDFAATTYENSKSLRPGGFASYYEADVSNWVSIWWALIRKMLACLSANLNRNRLLAGARSTPGNPGRGRVWLLLAKRSGEFVPTLGTSKA